MLDHLLTKKQKKALEKHFNSKASKERHKRMDKIFDKWESERINEQNLRHERRTELWKQMKWPIVIVIVIYLISIG